MKYYGSNRGKTVLSVVCVVLVFLLAASIFVGIFSKGFKDWNVKEWFGRQDDEKEPATEGSFVLGGDEPGMNTGIQVNFLAASVAESENSLTKTLQAVIEPDNATNKAVDWRVEFDNPASAWANGKIVTDYVTITPQSDGATTATLSCKAAFGEKVKIVVTSRDDTTISGYKTADYKKRITDMIVTLHNDSKTGAVVSTETADGISFPFNDNSSKLFLTVSTEYSVGTVTDNFDFQASCSVSGTLEVYIASTDFGGNNDYTPTVNYSNIDSISFRSGYLFLNQFIPLGYEDAGGVYHPTPTSVLNGFYNRVANGNPNPLATFDFVATGEYSTFSKSVNVRFTPGTLKFSVTDIRVDGGNITF